MNLLHPRVTDVSASRPPFPTLWRGKCYRTTADIDVWIAVHRENAAKLVRLLREFGIDVPELSEELFLHKGRIIRMGMEPTRIEIITEISGCDFAECYAQKVEGILDAIPVRIISLPQLIKIKNKIKSGRLKDLQDVQKLTSNLLIGKRNR